MELAQLLQLLNRKWPLIRGLLFYNMNMKKILSVLIVLLVLCGCSKTSNNSSNNTSVQITSSSQMAGKVFGITTGSIYDTYLREKFPNSEFVYFNTRPELVLALQSRKIDGIMLDDYTAVQYLKDNSNLTYIDEEFLKIDNGFIFPKNKYDIREEFNDYLSNCQENGYLDYLKDKWVTNFTNETRVPDVQFYGNRGELSAITATDSIPMSFIADGSLQGYEVELFNSFCTYAGYIPNIQSGNLDSVVTAIATGKYSVGFCGLSVTEERKKNVDFSDTVYLAGSMLVVLNQNVSNQQLTNNDSQTSLDNNQSSISGLSGQRNSYFDTIKYKFNQMFIEENRWLLILDGIRVTLLITIFSLIIGTVLGFILYLVCAKTNPFVRRFFDRVSFVINRIPVILILMFMFYIVFSDSPIDGAYISVFGFSIIETFSVYSMLNTGISAIDKGQTEGALALGYTDNQALFKFVLPQALKIIMPSYKNDIVSLIKATSVVGYITVQDLTRVSDIIRSRTYEAFFPLLVSAIIYFFLAWLLCFIVEKIQKRFLPNEKTKDSIINQYK